jgi:hypothetical protein
MRTLMIMPRNPNKNLYGHEFGFWSSSLKCIDKYFRIVDKPWRIELQSSGQHTENSSSEFCPGFLFLPPEKVRGKK